MTERIWETYEEVAAFLLNRLSNHFGVGRFEGKQIVPGASGTAWELDAKGVGESDGRIIVVECKRHTKAGISQAIAGSLAFTIRDIGAQGGILVSPLGLQEGARKVAASTNIVEITLSPTSTTTDYLLKFLDQIHIGLSDTTSFSEEVTIEVHDKNGNLISRSRV